MEIVFSSLIQALRKSLTRMWVQGNLIRFLIPDSFDNSLRYNFGEYLQLLKVKSKMEFDCLCSNVVNKPTGGPSSAIREVVTVVPRSPLNRGFFSHPVLKGTSNHNVYWIYEVTAQDTCLFSLFIFVIEKLKIKLFISSKHIWLASCFYWWMFFLPFWLLRLWCVLTFFLQVFVGEATDLLYSWQEWKSNYFGILVSLHIFWVECKC
jgi:hypothetical protein